MDTTTKSSPLEEAITNAVRDDYLLLTNLSKLQDSDTDTYNIVTDLPAYPDPEIILGIVKRWREVQKMFNKDLRIYAWSYNKLSEKYVLGCVQNLDGIYVTVLPAELRRKDK